MKALATQTPGVGSSVMKKITLSVLLASVLLVVTGCCNTDPHPASTAKCKASVDGDKCGECCKAEGRNGHTFVSGSGCTCL